MCRFPCLAFLVLLVCWGCSKISVENQMQSLEKPCLRFTFTGHQISPPSKREADANFVCSQQLVTFDSFQNSLLFQLTHIIAMNIRAKGKGMEGAKLRCAIFNKTQQGNKLKFDLAIWDRNLDFHLIEDICWNGKDERVLYHGANWSVSLTNHRDSLGNESLMDLPPSSSNQDEGIPPTPPPPVLPPPLSNLLLDQSQSPDFILLATALDKEADIICELAHPMFPEFPYVEKAIFYKKISNNRQRPDLRLELFQDGELEVVFLQNINGVFAIDQKRGIIAKGEDFFTLFRLESIRNKPAQNILKYSQYVREKATYHGRPCHKIMLSIPESLWDLDPQELEKTLNFNLPVARKEMQMIFPYRREYLIDDDTGMIVSLSKKNYFNKEIFSQNCGEVQFFPDWSKFEDNLFETPNFNMICAGECAFLQFRRDADELALARARGFLRSPSQRFTDFFHLRVRNNLLIFLSRFFKWFAGISFATCVIAFIIRRRKEG